MGKDQQTESCKIREKLYIFCINYKDLVLGQHQLQRCYRHQYLYNLKKNVSISHFLNDTPRVLRWLVILNPRMITRIISNSKNRVNNQLPAEDRRLVLERCQLLSERLARHCLGFPDCNTDGYVVDQPDRYACATILSVNYR